MPGIEANNDLVWVAKQTAKGTPAVTAIKQPRKVAGDINTNPDHGTENYSDGGRFTNYSDFYNTLVGNGNPTVQGQPGILAYLSYLMLGQETVTGSADPYTHVATPNTAGSFWQTWWKKVGQAVGPLRQQFNDCKLVSLDIQASSASKIVRAIPTFVSLDPGVVYTSDPIQTFDTEDPFLFTEGTGRMTIDGAVYQGNSSVQFTVTDSVTPWYGDGVRPYDVVYGVGNITLQAITILVDQHGLDFYNQKFYGTTTPVVGQKPLTTVPAPGSYSIDLRRGAIYTVGLGSPTAGNFTLTVAVGGLSQTTANIAYNATSTAVQTALQALPNVGSGSPTGSGVTVTGTAPNYTIVFGNSAVTLTGTFTGLTGGTGVVTSVGPQRQFKVEFPSVHWNPDMAIAGNPNGGVIELPLGATTRSSTGNPQIRLTTVCADPAYT